MKKLKDNGIYAIARIVTFKDPIYTERYPERAILDKRTGEAHKQQDGLRWASAYDRQLWEYDVAVAKEAARVGFNEIQFDYVRLPDSGGGKLDEHLDYRNTGNESKPQIIQDFLKYAYKELSPEGSVRFCRYLRPCRFGYRRYGIGPVLGGYQQCGGLCKPYDVSQPLRQPHLSIAGT